jgi:N-acyl-D-aspartate/D-glutamate deacylase
MRYALGLLCLVIGCQTLQAAGPMHDVVILGGRVIDPESGLDALRNIGIVAGRIATVTPEPMSGALVLDAQGKVVAPGFIDLHSHGQDPANYVLKAQDGVTTALELEVGTDDVDQ